MPNFHSRYVDSAVVNGKRLHWFLYWRLEILTATLAFLIGVILARLLLVGYLQTEIKRRLLGVYITLLTFSKTFNFCLSKLVFFLQLNSGSQFHHG